MYTVEQINQAIHDLGGAGRVSDGYHTFDELYQHRTLLFASLCNTTLNDIAWKSREHHDPDFPMYDGMFIVGVQTAHGQATYHVDNSYWDIFHVKELARAEEFDGHTPDQALERIFKECLDRS